MTGVLTAVGPQWDSRLATAVEAARELELTRRCADVADLLAAAAAGLGAVALVSDDLRGLDLSVVATLQGCRVVVVGVSLPGDEGSERRLRQLGIQAVVPADVGPADLAEVVRTASERQAGPAGDHADADTEAQLLLEGGRGPGVTSRASSATSAVADFPPPPGDEAAAPSRVVAVWGPCGAPGRTSVAVNLAAELALRGTPTLLVDADTYGGSVAQALSLLDEAPGLAAAARAAEQGTLDLPALARLAPEVLPGMRVLTGIPRADRWPELREAAMERIFHVARLLARVVVVDCGFNLEDDEELSYDTLAPRRNAATLTSLATADTVLAVGACDPVGLQRLVRGLQELGTVPSGEVQVLVNRMRPGAVGPRPEEHVTLALQRFAGVVPALFVPDDPASFDTALLQGRVLAECAPTSAARPALRALAASLSTAQERTAAPTGMTTAAATPRLSSPVSPWRGKLVRKKR